MDQSNNLNLEQQLKLVIIQRKIQELDIQQSRQYLTIVLRHMLMKDNIIKFLIKQKRF